MATTNSSFEDQALRPGSIALAAEVGREIMPEPLRSSHDEILAARPDLAGRDLVLYDGDCGLCDHSVRFLLARDRRDRLRFAPLQSSWAAAALARQGSPPTREDSMHVLAELGTPRERLLLRSAAALRLAGAIGFPWSLLRAFWIVPRPLRDGVYRFVARNRKRWFAAPSCPIGAARPAGAAAKLLDGEIRER
jgi:predicted DCC family thiol-disulfide oxidoreductase YuxK